MIPNQLIFSSLLTIFAFFLKSRSSIRAANVLCSTLSNLENTGIFFKIFRIKLTCSIRNAVIVLLAVFYDVVRVHLMPEIEDLEAIMLTDLVIP